MSEKEVIIPIEDAAIYAQKYVIPVIALFLIPYLIIHQGLFVIQVKSNIYFLNLYIAFGARGNIIDTIFLPIDGILNSFNHFGWLILSLLPAVVLHELLHAIAAIIFANGKLKSVSFGFDKKTLTPYTHCKETLFIWQYRIVLILPGIVLGIIPGLLGIILKSPEFLVFGILFTFGALGDFLMLVILKNYPSKKRIKDHPTTLGFFIID
jgi:hypothetical protein